MPIEFHRDGPWHLPEGWVWARLGDIAQVNPSTPFDDLPAEPEIPFLPMAAMAQETGMVDLSQRRPVAQLIKGYTRFQTGCDHQLYSFRKASGASKEKEEWVRSLLLQ
jgi:hypothetical protein